MNTLNYSLLDVFTKTPFGGNQLAVFQPNKVLPTETMQKIARELNLSESVFIYPADDSNHEKRLRIFTPHVELPMAGHPTIGAAYLLADQGIVETKEGENEWIFEEGVGDVPVTVHKENSEITKVEMQQPTPLFGDQFSNIEAVTELLSLSINELDTSLPIQTVSSGVPFLYIPIRSLSAIQNIHFRADIWEKYFSGNPNTKHIFTFTTETEHQESTVHSRMFAPAMGISEDPATGAASGPLGAYLVENGVVSPNDNDSYLIKSEQGLELGRPSYIDISIRKDGNGFKKVKIGGNSVIIGSGQLNLF
ncbi:PhzF family phenazine biosynthesis protein [Pseudalkalibacillus decolorationis]|uniref:PhzF family phenazine biosynthesis protein n=1 Tax=Pseudalkalibacillus decolorationis TaxID=163879 RepID=UPI00214814F8|nr:PhzF family phenazine biosynthesis protein [Pseudalkalibacillus decolorationis]